MPRLELKLLGGLEVLHDGRPLSELKTHKGQALLAFLAVTRQPASRAALAALLWPDKLEAKAYTNLRKVLVRLKPLSDYLHVTHDTLAFDFAAPHTLDIADFEAGLEGTADVSRLESAVGLFQGDFLEGFGLDDAPAFEAWAQTQRTRLRSLALEALQTLVAHFTQRADYDAALRYARRLLALEPWHEEAHRDVMRLLALSGKRSAALAQFEACRASLAAELGVEPELATVQLYEQIKHGDLDGPEPGAGRWLSGPAHNLPTPATPLIGRQHELAAVAAHLADPNVRLLTILGLGGMGKTRLALAAAAAQLTGDGSPGLFPHGVCYVSLARLELPDQLVPAIAEALNLRFVAGSEPTAQVLDYLRHKAMLLVLDNFEHMRPQARLLADLLSVAGRLKLLVTSRESLSLQAECLLPIGGLALPPDAAETALPEPLQEFGAIQLFCECARRVRPGFALTQDIQKAVLEICRQVQGMPLGIVLAAAWLEMFSPQEIAAETRASQDFLACEMADMPERQRSLRAAFEHSWRLLPEAERVAFQRLSVFRGGFTRAAAQTVTGATLRHLHGLVSKSFLAVSPEGRYDVHELLRQFAAEKLAAAPEAEAHMQERHSAYYCSLLQTQSGHWHTARQLEALATVTGEVGNVQRAWQWALEQGECLRLVAAIDSWGWYHLWLNLVAEGRAAFQGVAERAQELASDGQSTLPELFLLWAKALGWQGWLTPHALSAIEILQTSLSLFERPELAERDTRRERAFVLGLLSGPYYGRDRKTARRLKEQSLALYQACNDPWGIASTIGGLGYLDWATGRYQQALNEVQDCLAMHRARGDIQETAGALDGLAWIYQHLGDLDQAIQLRREALALHNQLGDRSAAAHEMATLSATLIWYGRFAEGHHWAQNSLDLCRELGSRAGEGFARLHITMAQLFTGQYEPARREATLALALIRETGDLGEEASAHWLLGSLALVEGDTRVAAAAFSESRQLYEAVQDNYLGLALPGPGVAACMDGRLAEAQTHLAEALRFALGLKDYLYAMMALPGAALYLTLAGEVERAAEIWELAQRQPHVGNSRWYADIAGHRVEASVSGLPAASKEAAIERGRSLGLWETAQRLVQELGCYPVSHAA